jgi:4-aminobutyrate aminotransferase / (S)-3-amino-2-methylpropionate transaminase / 5-aminovalerate transaminase
MPSIRLLTDIPGPRSRELAARAPSALARAVAPGDDIFGARAEGAVIEDVDGNRYLDFTGGVGCLAAGHAHPRVVAAVREQAARFLHTDFSVVAYEGYVALAERIAAAMGGNRKLAFFNSGAEAIENAVKIAKGATGRGGLICFEGAFHGRTLLTMTLTAREVPVKKGFGPFAPEVYRAPYPGLRGATVEESLAAVERLLGEHQIAAVVVEPVLGEGGFVIPPPEFLQGIEALCRAAGTAFVADEIQAGYGKTGRFLASDHSGVRPDLVVLGKAIASGLPLSAVAGDPAWMDALVPHALGGTYVGNPVACAAGLAVLDVIEEEGLIERAAAIGARLMEGWNKIAARSGAIAQVRGLGSMVGVEFHDAAVVGRVLSGARSRGVLAIPAGEEGRVIRHLMPLVTTDAQLDEAFEVFDAAVEEAAAR